MPLFDESPAGIDHPHPRSVSVRSHWSRSTCPGTPRGHSDAARSQPPVSAAVAAVVDRNSSSKASGSAALRTAPYGKMHSPRTPSKRAPGVTGRSRKPVLDRNRSRMQRAETPHSPARTWRCSLRARISCVGQSGHSAGMAQCSPPTSAKVGAHSRNGSRPSPGRQKR